MNGRKLFMTYVQSKCMEAKRLIKKLKSVYEYCVNTQYIKSWKEMTLFEQYQYARNNFQYYALHLTYNNFDDFRIQASQKERNYYAEKANYWDAVIKSIRAKIIEQSKTKQ